MTFTVQPDQQGRRLDQLLAELLPEKTRSAVQKLISDGMVLVNNSTVPKNHKIRSGDLISLEEPEPVPPDAEPENIPLSIVYEDNDLLVVNKPRGMVVHPAPGNYTGTLVNALLYHCRGSLSGINGSLRPGIVHRIDKDTSGLLIVAKSDRAHQSLSAQISEHSFDRVYEAVVCGRIREDSGELKNYIGRHPKDRKKMAVLTPESAGAREAVTRFEVIERYPGFTHVRCILETGRTHQIRVQMAAIGHPVAGDPVYGPKKPSPLCHGLNGQCLHARNIAFTHPVTGERLAFTSPLPDYFVQFLDRLKKQSGSASRPMEGILFAADCDGTLLNSDKIITEGNIAAVRRFRELGGQFTLATGRSLPTAQKYARQLEIDFPVILYNGAMIYHPVQDRVLWETHLPEEVKSIPEKAAAKFPGLAIEVHAEDMLYAVAWNNFLEEHLNGTNPIPHMRCPVSEVMDKNWTKILFAYPEDKIGPLIEWLGEQNIRQVRFARSDYFLYEILPFDAGKGSALKKLCEITGFPMRKTAAMGDYYNDLEMIREAGFSAAPSDACDEVRLAADYIADSCNHDAVADAISYLIEHPSAL